MIAGASRLSGVCGAAASQLKLARQVITQLGTGELPNGRTFGGTDRIQTAVRGGLSDGGRA